MPTRTSSYAPSRPDAPATGEHASHPPDTAIGGTRSPAGSNYGDFAPAAGGAAPRDPSRGAEMERDVAPADADFSLPPPASRGFESAGGDADYEAGRATREDRIRKAAFIKYKARRAGSADALRDWLDAEAEDDAADRAR